jgi:hypothetical protein
MQARKGRNSRLAMCRPYRALPKFSQPPPRALPGAVLWRPLLGERNTAQHQNARPNVARSCIIDLMSSSGGFRWCQDDDNALVNS